MVCQACQRLVQNQHTMYTQHGPGVCTDFDYVYYVHVSRGCDTGCCGHTQFGVIGGRVYPIGDFTFDHDKLELDERIKATAHKYHCPVNWDRCHHYDCDN